MKKILIVDDSSAWIEFHKNYISELFIELSENYTLDTAFSALEGYDFLLKNNENPYDLIITDMQMEENFSPKYAGEWFIEQIKTFKNFYKTKIIICSGTYNIKQIAELYGVDYIPKRLAVNDVNEYKERLKGKL